MSKIIFFLLVLAFVYCVEAQPNAFNMLGMDRKAVHTSILQTMRDMMDPNNLKNQEGDGSMVMSSISNSEYQGFIANKKNGEYSLQRFSGPS